MTIRLRPHHLLCLQTYAGKGYSAAFTANFDRLAARLAAGEDIVIVEGPDDICAPLLGESEAHCRRDSVSERDREASRQLSELSPTPIATGTRLAIEPERLRLWRAAFARDSFRAACSGCEWHSLCGAIARDGFAGVSILPEPGTG
ncbi:MAG: 2Fe-2S ferredoxin [Pelagibacterium sp. SCN 63-23]|nr:MAG: 2Fe-2S ferredoxin [Pelagibacterium sp. SCN 63-23]